MKMVYCICVEFNVNWTTKSNQSLKFLRSVYDSEETFHFLYM
jgi:hypothetical protein